MTNDMAMDVLEQMRRDGLDPTPRDVVRLNAFGLRVDEAQGKRACESRYLLPRVAWLADGVYLRQPTIGHEIWIDSVSRFIAPGDYETTLAINCFALTRPHDQLPDPADPAVVETAAKAFCAKMAPFSRDQLYAAVIYVKFGCDPAIGEAKATAATAAVPAVPPTPDIDECIAVGVLRDGLAYLWGLSLADLKSLTCDEVRTAVRRSFVAHGMTESKDGENAALDDFYAVANEIRERLVKERDAKRKDH